MFERRLGGGGGEESGGEPRGRKGRKGRGCGWAMAFGEEQQQLGEKGAASAWWTIDAEDSIGLLRIMIAISCQVARVINPILSDPSARRWSSKATSVKHNFGQQKGQEEQRKRPHICHRQKNALLTAFSDLPSDLFSDSYAP